jgi:hypothetical protein
MIWEGLLRALYRACKALAPHHPNRRAGIQQQKIQMLNAADEICARARKQSSASPVSR